MKILIIIYQTKQKIIFGMIQIKTFEIQLINKPNKLKLCRINF